MATQKFIPASSGATHVAAPATIVDLIMPTTELVGSTSNLLRSGIHIAGAWLLATKRHTGNWGF